MKKRIAYIRRSVNMKAAVFKEARTLVVQDVPQPEAGVGEVLVKVKDVGICGSDLHLYLYGFLPPDYIMGHEGAGTIAAVGPDVAGWKEGDRVWIIGGTVCGACDRCREGLTEACRNPLSIGTGALPGAYAEYIKVPARFLTRLPDDVGMREATLIDPIGCAHYPVKLSEIKAGQSALVMGAGPIGLFAVQYLKTLGVNPIILSEPVARRAELATEFGADFILDPTKVSMDGEIRKLTRDIGPDVVFECVGVPATILDSVALARRGGRVVWVGVCMEEVAFFPALWTFKKPTIFVSFGMGPKEAVGGYLEFIRQNQSLVGKAITEIITLDELPAAFERLLKPNTEMKVLVEFD
jgi:2-desacetyl-2-hydroxyethyl bacteriochlorophyllide A dehydrogenase